MSVTGQLLRLHEQLYNAYRHNPGLNFGIVVVFLIGVVYIFWQVLRLNREITWIDHNRGAPLEKVFDGDLHQNRDGRKTMMPTQSL